MSERNEHTLGRLQFTVTTFDITERLRTSCDGIDELMNEAADEIERLRKELEIAYQTGGHK